MMLKVSVHMRAGMEIDLIKTVIKRDTLPDILLSIVVLSVFVNKKEGMHSSVVRMEV